MKKRYVCFVLTVCLAVMALPMSASAILELPSENITELPIYTNQQFTQFSYEATQETDIFAGYFVYGGEDGRYAVEKAIPYLFVSGGVRVHCNRGGSIEKGYMLSGTARIAISPGIIRSVVPQSVDYHPDANVVIGAFLENAGKYCGSLSGNVQLSGEWYDVETGANILSIPAGEKLFIEHSLDVTSEPFNGSGVVVIQPSTLRVNGLGALVIGKATTVTGLDLYQKDGVTLWNSQTLTQEKDTETFVIRNEKWVAWTPGDVNEDGVTDSADALKILQYAVGKTGIASWVLSVADLDNDFVINSADALMVLKIAVGSLIL